MTTLDGQAAAKAIREEVEAVIRRLHIPRVLHGTVTSVGWGNSPPVVTFTEPVPPGTTAVGRPNIRFQDGYQPSVGDTVIAAAVGDDIWIWGPLSTDTGPVAVQATGSGTTPLPVEFGSTWTNFGTPWQVAQYRLVGNEVVWSGVIAQSSGTVNDAQIAQAHGTTLLPANLRPSSGNRIFNVRGNTGSDLSLRVSVDTGGQMFVEGASPNNEAAYLSLDGVRYYVDQ